VTRQSRCLKAPLEGGRLETSRFEFALGRPSGFGDP